MTPFAVIVSWSGRTVMGGEVTALLEPLLFRCPDGTTSVQVQGGAASVGLRVIAKGESLADGVLVDEGRSRLVVGDVRLYDRDAVIRRLGGDSVMLSEMSDLALAVEALDRLGYSALSDLAGDFAFLIWDWRVKELKAIRDHFGLRPLYYCVLGPDLAIASDVRQLLVLPGLDRQVDPEMSLDYLLGDHGHHGLTFFRNIKEVWPAHFLSANSNSLRQTRYWGPPSRPFEGDYAEALAEWARLLQTAVRDRLDSAHPIAAHLSGGLDSGSVVGAAHDLYRGKPDGRPTLTTLSAMFPGLDCDERQYVDVMRDFAPLFQHFEWDGTVRNPGDLEDPVVARPGLREGLGWGPRFEVDHMRALGVGVLLTGTGGDELGWGHGVLRDLVKRGRLFALGLELAHMGSVSRAWGHLKANLVGVGQGRRPSEPPRWLGEKLAQIFPGAPDDRIAGDFDFTSQVQAEIWKVSNLPYASTLIDVSVLVGADSGVEVRMPYRDLRLVNFALSLPWKFRLPKGDMRRLQRDAIRPFLPTVIGNRLSKSLFSSAIRNQLRANLPRLHELFHDRSWKSDLYLDRAAARRVFSRMLAEDPKFSETRAWVSVWRIAVFEIWFRKKLAYTGDLGDPR